MVRPAWGAGSRPPRPTCMRSASGQALHLHATPTASKLAGASPPAVPQCAAGAPARQPRRLEPRPSQAPAAGAGTGRSSRAWAASATAVGSTRWRRGRAPPVSKLCTAGERGMAERRVDAARRPLALLPTLCRAVPASAARSARRSTGPSQRWGGGKGQRQLQGVAAAAMPAHTAQLSPTNPAALSTPSSAWQRAARAAAPAPLAAAAAPVPAAAPAPEGRWRRQCTQTPCMHANEPSLPACVCACLQKG